MPWCASSIFMRLTSIVIYSACRVGSSYLVAECLSELTLLFVNVQMDKVQLGYNCLVPISNSRNLPMLSILFVEDDATIAMGVEYSLKQDGFQVSLAYRLEEARDLLKRRPFDLVLLDLGLPDGSGYTLCKEIRAAGDTPIIILSARDEEASIVLGLDLGADDYLTKPFRLRELISRMKAVLRRRGPVEASDRTLTCGEVTVVAQQAKVYKNGREVLLTALEYRLLLALV